MKSQLSGVLASATEMRYVLMKKSCDRYFVVQWFSALVMKLEINLRIVTFDINLGVVTLFVFAVDFKARDSS